MKVRNAIFNSHCEYPEYGYSMRQPGSGDVQIATNAAG
jgi:hypothetical protein